MKKKKTNNKENTSVKTVDPKQAPFETSEEAYRLINSRSFKQNFKLLIAHYKQQPTGNAGQ